MRPFRFFSCVAAAAAALLLTPVAAHAQGTIYHVFRSGNPITSSPGTITQSDSGTPVSLEIDYSTFSKDFHLQAEFAPNGGVLPNSMIFVVNRGPMPAVGQSGKYTIFYVDGINSAAPIVTAYAYNGAGDVVGLGDSIFTSWQFGNAISGTTAGALPADKIASSLTTPGFATGQTTQWFVPCNPVNEVCTGPGGDTKPKYTRGVRVSDLGNGNRQFTIDVNTAVIESHSPLYPSNGWEGTSFGPTIGAWIFGTRYSSTTYTNGYLSSAALQGGLTGGHSNVELLNETVDSCPQDCLGIEWGNTPVLVCFPTPVPTVVPTSTPGILATPTPVVPTPSPAPEAGSCSFSDFTTQIFALDGGASGLNEAIKVAAARFQKLKPRDKNIARYVASALKQADQVHTQAWSAAWSFPQRFGQCTGSLSASCKVQDLSATSASYVSLTAKLRTIGQQVVSRMRRLRVRNNARTEQNLLNQFNKNYQESIDLTKQIPSSTILCS